MGAITNSFINPNSFTLPNSTYAKLSRVEEIIQSLTTALHEISHQLNDLKSQQIAFQIKEARNLYEKHSRIWHIAYTVLETTKWMGVTLPFAYFVGTHMTNYPLALVGLGACSTFVAMESQLRKEAKIMADLFELKINVYLSFHPNASVKEATKYAQESLSTLDWQYASFYYQRYKEFVETESPKEFRLIELHVKEIKEFIKTQNAVEDYVLEQTRNI